MSNPKEQSLLFREPFDLGEVTEFEIRLAPDGRVWVNVDGLMVLRVLNAKHVLIHDNRAKPQGGS